MSQPGTTVWNDGTRTVTTFDTAGAVVDSRPYTAAENAAADAAAATATATTNGAGLIVKGRAAMASNATYLAIVNPTAVQAIPQVEKLTRQVNALIKLEIGDLQDTSGT